MIPPAGGSDSGAEWETHPGYDGAGLHRVPEEGAQGRHHENSRPGEAEENAVQRRKVETSPCNMRRN